MNHQTDDGDVSGRAAARVADLAAATGERLDDIARKMQVEIAESIPELRGDPLMLELLYASVESNVRTFFHVAHYAVPIDSVEAPRPAVEYARRLAQREISSNALLRAYRLGHRQVLDWVSTELALVEDDPQVSFAALRMLQAAAFAYIDRVSEKVVDEYQTERDRWLANRNTIRMVSLDRILAESDADVAAAEKVLGYRLRQDHLALVLWTDETTGANGTLDRLETLVNALAAELGSGAKPLFVPQDRSLGWAWVPMGSGAGVDLRRLSHVVAEAGADVRAATGAVSPGISGFRMSHRQSLRAHHVAVVGADRGRQITPFTAPGVPAVAVLANDLPTARELVATMLGDLAEDEEGVARLRETLTDFLHDNQSFVSTAAKVHLHKNTVKYRVDKALKLRGRPVEDDRFDLELALAACRWLGSAVLPRSL